MALKTDFAALKEKLGGIAPLSRFAPSPTGYLHLGHIVNAIYVWGITESLGGKVILRLENHDRIRCKPAFEQELLDDLDWLGFQPDFGTTKSFRSGSNPYRQSDCAANYLLAFEHLKQKNLVYACECSRKEILARSPQKQGSELRYDGHCSSKNLPLDAGHTLRVRIPDEEVVFDDLLIGKQTQNPAQQIGDFAIRDKHGNWTYQFCVVIDDLHQNIDLIIRGMDILSSTGRQIILRRMLQPEHLQLSTLRYAHHPLLTDIKGRKLSKKDFDADIRSLRLQGQRPSSLIGKAAFAAKLTEKEKPLKAANVVNLFD